MTSLLHIVLYEPEIPPNTGNIMRLCANTGCHLHLIEPLGFELNDKHLRRAGLDYSEWVDVNRYHHFDAFLHAFKPERLWAFTTKGHTALHEIVFEAGDAMLFGPESRGLPENLLARFHASQRIRIPMLPQSRSLNLSNTVAIACYEAWRQLDFVGAQ